MRIGVVVLSMLTGARMGYAQADNAEASSQSNNGYAKVTLTAIPAVREEVSADKISREAAADSAWKALPVYESKYPGISKEERTKQAVLDENFFREYFEKGFNFWQAFPEDQRRYEWLRLAAGGFSPPRYWENIEEGARLSAETPFYSARIDKRAMERWNSVIEKCRDEYLKEPTVPKETKNSLMVAAAYNIFSAALNLSYVENKEIFLAELKHTFDTAVDFIDNDDSASKYLVNVASKMFLESMSYGLTTDDLRNFVTRYKGSSNTFVRNWVEQELRLLNTNLSNVPLFNDSLFGKQLELQAFKGKVIILDYWNIYCSTCIARMTEMKPLYEKYKGSGFEIISVSIDPQTQQEKVDKILKKSAGDWTHIIIGGKDEAEARSQNAPWKKIWDLYGFDGVPQMVLFDRAGNVAMINGLLLFGNPEMIIKNLLEENKPVVQAAN